MLFGAEAVAALAAKRVAVFGVGGVGGYAVEVLARSGVGNICLIDNDCVCVTNINRQIIALHSTIGKPKVEVAKERVADINPECKVCAKKMFYLPENADDINLGSFDYVVDCIDTVAAKLELIRRCRRAGVPIICSMGAANKVDATAFRVADISKTKMDPLAKVIRQKLAKEGIKGVKVVYSEEPARTPFAMEESACDYHDRCPEAATCGQEKRRTTPASNAFVPAAAGLIIGGEVVKDLMARSIEIV